VQIPRPLSQHGHRRRRDWFAVIFRQQQRHLGGGVARGPLSRIVHQHIAEKLLGIDMERVALACLDQQTIEGVDISLA